MHFKKPTTLAFGAIVFFLGGVGVLYLGVRETILIIEQIQQEAPLVVIPKGAFYFFGGVINCFCASYAFIYESIVKQKPSKRFLKIWGTVFFGSFILMFTLPHLIHYPLANELRSMGYTYCAEKSRYWLLDSNIAYVIDPALCMPDKNQSNELDKSSHPTQLKEQMK